MPRGGKREGAGKPKGYKHEKTLDKLEARAYLRRMVIAELEPMTTAQIAAAKGISHFFLRDEDGKFVRITDPTNIETALNCGEQGKYYWIFTKDPSIQAYTDLMNRALDKPSEHMELTGADGGALEVVLLSRLQAGRQRG